MRRVVIASEPELAPANTVTPTGVCDKDYTNISEEFTKELESLINCHSLENGSNTPDFMLADFIVNTIKNFNTISNKREAWYGTKNVPGQSSDLDIATENLMDLIKIQCTDGNWNYDQYMHGLANGLICALSVLTGEEPKFMEAPSEWMIDKPKAILPVVAPEVETSSSSLPLRNVVRNCIKQIAIALDNSEILTMGKAYGVFKKIGITGFKSPRWGGNKGKQIVKNCTIKTKSNKIFWISMKSKDGGIQYQLSKPGSENYSCVHVTRVTSDINKFLKNLLGVRGLSEFHSDIKNLLDEGEE